MNDVTTLYPADWKEYELIDTGDGMKLERFGQYIVARPDPRAIWEKSDEKLWNTADAMFVRTSSTEGNWDIKKSPPVPCSSGRAGFVTSFGAIDKWCRQLL